MAANSLSSGGIADNSVEEEYSSTEFSDLFRRQLKFKGVDYKFVMRKKIDTNNRTIECLLLESSKVKDDEGLCSTPLLWSRILE